MAEKLEKPQMSDTTSAQDNTVIIKKYANRRLYNTRSSSYITLDHLAKMTREQVDFRVLDAKTGTDITHQILTQIIMEEESSGEHMYGNSMQGMLPGYLEASMEHFHANQVKLRKAFEESIEANPLAKLAQQNMAMFKAATAAFIPGAEGHGEKAEAAPASDLDGLRAQMAEMQRQLDALSK